MLDRRHFLAAVAPIGDMPTATFHEGVPGHHLQITPQRECALPNYRKVLFFGAYVEG